MRRFLVLLLALVGSASAAFVPPAEGPVPFRRDKLPVDVDTMTKLSRQLVVLAGQMDPDKPNQSRTVAQLLALSQALDPSNNQVRDLVQQVSEGGEVPRAEEREVNLAQARAWDLLGWLELPEAGEDGQALGACLSDVLIKADPQHPSSKKRVDSGERGAWSDWVADVGRFGVEKAPDLAKTDEETDGQTDSSMEEGDAPEETEEVPEMAKIALPEVTCSMPIRYYSKKLEKTLTGPVEFTLKTSVKGDTKKMVLQLPGEDWSAANKRSNDDLYQFLESRYGSLPPGLNMKFSLPEGISMDLGKHADAFAGLLTVMANATFSGVPPTGIVFAGIGEGGELKGSRNFWETIRQLSKADADSEEGGRMVIPNAMREFLPPLLTLSEAEFFFRYEVLLADDVDDLLTMSSSDPGKELAEPLNAFAMIKEVKGTRSLGSFVSHASTQQRLGQVVAMCPAHASARMLALRGTSGWAKRLDRKLYAMELRSALEPMGKVLSDRWESMKLSDLSDAEDQCKEGLAEVEKLYGSVAGRTELHDPTLTTAKGLAGLASDLKRMQDERWMIPTRVRRTYLEYVDTMKLLTDAVGDNDSYPLPDREKTR